MLFSNYPFVAFFLVQQIPNGFVQGKLALQAGWAYIRTSILEHRPHVKGKPNSYSGIRHRYYRGLPELCMTMAT